MARVLDGVVAKVLDGGVEILIGFNPILRRRENIINLKVFSCKQKK